MSKAKDIFAADDAGASPALAGSHHQIDCAVLCDGRTFVRQPGIDIEAFFDDQKQMFVAVTLDGITETIAVKGVKQGVKRVDPISWVK